MFIAYDGNGAIWGLGEDRTDALADAAAQGIPGFALALSVIPCSTKLAQDVMEIGGRVRWLVVDGVAHSMVPAWDDDLEVEAQYN